MGPAGFLGRPLAGAPLARAVPGYAGGLRRNCVCGRHLRQPRPNLRVSSGVQRPVLVGLFRTTILIPSHYDEPEASPEFLKLSLLHELAHAEQSDPWFGTIASLAQSVWFFLPHVWWLRSQLIMDQEFMADNAASLRYGTSSRYAASLLSLADSRPAQAARGRRRRRTFDRVIGREIKCALAALSANVDAPALSVSGRAASATALVVVAAAGSGRCLPRVGMCLHSLASRSSRRTRANRRGPLHDTKPSVCLNSSRAPLVLALGGRALPYHMPVALSSHFNLTVEVLASTQVPADGSHRRTSADR